MKQEESEQTKKDAWDKFRSMSTFISGMLIALIGLFFTHVYNTRQNAMKGVEIAREFMPYLVEEGDREEMRRVALLFIGKLGIKEKELALNVGKDIDSPGAKSAVDKMMASPSITDEKGQLETPITSQVPTEKEFKKGWAYLGDYSATEGRWDTRYFDFDSTADPYTFLNLTLEVRRETGALNVRQGMPTPAGSFQGVIDILNVGSKVKIVDVRPWSSTGYMWAQISYKP